MRFRTVLAALPARCSVGPAPRERDGELRISLDLAYGWNRNTEDFALFKQELPALGADQEVLLGGRRLGVFKPFRAVGVEDVNRRCA